MKSCKQAIWSKQATLTSFKTPVSVDFQKLLRLVLGISQLTIGVFVQKFQILTILDQMGVVFSSLDAVVWYCS